MAIKDILLHIGAAEGSAERIDAAVGLARAHGAHVTGLYTLWMSPIPAYIEGQLGKEVLENQRRMYLDQAQAARTALEARAAAEGVPCQWHQITGDVSRAITLHARYSDLVITGVDDEGTGGTESVILTCAKPVIVMPRGAVASMPGRHLMVAWDGSRESTRAVDAALPLMRSAERVDVVCVDPVDEDHGAIPGADLCTHLARHDVRAEAQGVDSGGHGAGETLLGRAGADGADLLVMGAYGHSRWREVVLGGATNHVLHHAHIPVLMAH